MADLQNQFGQLSTNAPEWKPGGNASASLGQGQPPSDLNAAAVKEFVPGAGWSAAPSASVQEEEVQEMKPKKSTIPSGPSPPALPMFRGLHNMGLGDDLWRHYRDMSLDATRQMDPNDPLHKAVPLPYCNALCLDQKTAAGSSRSSSYGYPSATFQVTSREDGNLYCLHRFDNVRSVSPKIALTVSERFNVAGVQEHPGIVPFYQCFMASLTVNTKKTPMKITNICVTVS